MTAVRGITGVPENAVGNQGARSGPGHTNCKYYDFGPTVYSKQDSKCLTVRPFGGSNKTMQATGALKTA